ncbi:sugar ABC transporter substrate-binding protein [Poseidonocella sp. HB161398]|uniref:ABC transporter substrate-binding protein n=1 Tax=Poseidonocella sp. HB161398 TaxID=2320855 RepID=UPI0019820791|nr:sugar ABC transporter substrate-binding protein [Poseidonocella sp. HB161398]
MERHDRMIKRLIGASALMAGMLGTTAMAEELRFTVWTGSDAHLAMLDGIAASYTEKHPDVTVRFETIPFADYVQKITLQLAGGNPPDLGWLLENSAPTFVDAGVLLDVSDTLKDTDGYDFDDLSQAAMGLWQEGGAVYGVPFSTSPFIIYYNASLYDAAGLEHPDVLAAKGEWTWERLKQDAAALADAEEGVWGFQSVDGQGYGGRVIHTLIPMIRSYGGAAWEDGTCGLSSDEAVEAVALYHDMIFKDRSAVPPGEQGDFFTGNAALTVTQLSRVSKLSDAGFDWGIAPLPSGPAGAVSVIGQAAVVAFAQGSQTELAADFLAHMTRPENVAVMAEFFPPARLSVLEDEAFLSSNAAVTSAQMKIVAEGIANGSVAPGHIAYPQIESAMRPKFDALWKPDADVKAVLEDVCAAIEPLL